MYFRIAEEHCESSGSVKKKKLNILEIIYWHFFLSSNPIQAVLPINNTMLYFCLFFFKVQKKLRETKL